MKTQEENKCHICDGTGGLWQMPNGKWYHLYCREQIKNLQPGQIIEVNWKIENGIIIKNPSRLSE